MEEKYSGKVLEKAIISAKMSLFVNYSSADFEFCAFGIQISGANLE